MSPRFLCPFTKDDCPAKDASIRNEKACPLHMDDNCAIYIIADKLNHVSHKNRPAAGAVIKK